MLANCDFKYGDDDDDDDDADRRKTLSITIIKYRNNVSDR